MSNGLYLRLGKIWVVQIKNEDRSGWKLMTRLRCEIGDGVKEEVVEDETGALGPPPSLAVDAEAGLLWALQAQVAPQPRVRRASTATLWED